VIVYRRVSLLKEKFIHFYILASAISFAVWHYIIHSIILYKHSMLAVVVNLLMRIHMHNNGDRVNALCLLFVCLI